MTLAALVVWETQQAQAITSRQSPVQQLPTPSVTLQTKLPQAATEGAIAQMVPDSGVGRENLVVRDVQIYFVNKDGKRVDKHGQPVQGYTHKDFILSKLQLKPGQLFSEEILEADLRRLRRLDSFEKVNVSLKQDATGVDIIYEVQERHFPTLGFGGGNSGDVGIYGRVGYTDENLGGINQQIDTNVQVSGKDVQFNSKFTSPYRTNIPFGYRISAFRSRDFSSTFNKNINLPNGDGIREGRFGGGVALLRSLNNWDAALGLNYTRISIRDRNWKVSPVDQFSNPLSLSGTGIDDLYTMSLAVTRDMRNNRSYPSQGSILTLSTEQSFPIGLGNVLMNRLRANYIQYVPVAWIGARQQTKNPELAEMLAFNLQAGTIFGNFSPAEAFNLGGSNSVRGYEQDSLISGRSFALASVEYRFPILSSLGGVIFTDLASDLGSANTVLGSPGVVRAKPGSGYGYGLGLRVKSPIGLIRADFGINDRGQFLLQVTTGQRF